MEGKMEQTANDTKILRIIFRKKIITIDTLSSLLNSSTKTARRRLKLWEAYTSYNENGRYYTLPDIPDFDANGYGLIKKFDFQSLVT